jgi:hypothetical protein
MDLPQVQDEFVTIHRCEIKLMEQKINELTQQVAQQKADIEQLLAERQLLNVDFTARKRSKPDDSSSSENESNSTDFEPTPAEAAAWAQAKGKRSSKHARNGSAPKKESCTKAKSTSERAKSQPPTEVEMVNVEESEPIPPNTQAPQQSQSRKGKPPPIFFKSMINWNTLKAKLGEIAVEPFEAKLIRQNFAIFLSTPADFRNVTRYLESSKTPFHTYRLEDEKLIRVVLRGVPLGVDTNEVQEELVSLGFNPTQVIRLKSASTKTELPLVLVSLPKETKSRDIYELRKVCYISIRVEPFKKAKGPGQCHRCQGFGHAQARCFEKPRCVKCAGGHLTKDCRKDKKAAPKCCNCSGEHPSSYRGCPSFPKTSPKSNQAPTDNTPKKAPTQAPRPTFNRASTKPGTSYAQVAAKVQAPSQTPQADSGLAGLLLNLLMIALSDPSKLQTLQKALQ